MKARKIILKASVVLLMLVFSQKSGAGLFVHNLLHSNSTESSAPADSKSKEVSIACNCIDDFLAPFAEGSSIEFSSPLFSFASPVSIHPEELMIVSLIPSTQRGPPADLL